MRVVASVCKPEIFNASAAPADVKELKALKELPLANAGRTDCLRISVRRTWLAALAVTTFFFLEFPRAIVRRSQNASAF